MKVEVKASITPSLGKHGAGILKDQLLSIPDEASVIIGKLYDRQELVGYKLDFSWMEER